MKYCEFCHTYKNDDRMIFCETCRSQLVDINVDNPTAPAGSFICPNCGNTYATDIGKCAFCGAQLVPLGSESTAEGVKRGGSDDKKKKMIIIIAAAALAVIIAVIALLLILHPGKADPDTDPDTTRITTADEAVSGDAQTPTENQAEMTGEEATDTADTEDIVTGSTVLSETEAIESTNPSSETTVPVITAPSTTAVTPTAAPAIRSASTLKGTVLSSSNVSSARTFGADQAIDKRPETCWCVNTDAKGGVGASIQFNLQSTAAVNGISIVNGNVYMPEELIYQSNGQIKECTLTFSDGSQKIVQLNYNPGSSELVRIPFDAPVVTSSIILTVNSAYVGQKYTTNVCLGEFDVF
jgi:hypothetical protein